VLALVAVSAPAIVIVGGAVTAGLVLDLVIKPKLFDAAGAGDWELVEAGS